jgi:broad specificity phosphatase PhoE
MKDPMPALDVDPFPTNRQNRLRRSASFSAERVKKIIYLVRHAQALHNVEEQLAREQTRARGGSVEDQEEARKSVLKDPTLKDAPLSKSGEQQVDQVAGSFAEFLSGTRYPSPNKVFVSPLQRALQTATRLFGERQPTVAKEFLREKRTGLPCDERKHSRELVRQFPHIDFTDIVEHDRKTQFGYAFVDLQQQKEENIDVKMRSKALLEFVKEEESEVVAIVAHKGFIREFINGPLAGMLDVGSKQIKAHAVFGNAEVWVLEAVWDLDDDDAGLRPPHVRAHSLDEAAFLPHMSLSTPLSVYPTPTRKCNVTPSRQQTPPRPILLQPQPLEGGGDNTDNWIYLSEDEEGGGGAT